MSESTHADSLHALTDIDRAKVALIGKCLVGYLNDAIRLAVDYGGGVDIGIRVGRVSHHLARSILFAKNAI